MESKFASSNAPNGSNISMCVSEDDIWFSQRAIADLFSCTKQNINIHLNDIFSHISTEKLKRHITVSQKEGSRKIQRSIMHFSLEVVHMIAIRSQSWSQLNWLVQLARGFGKQKDLYRIVPIKERDFGQLIIGLLEDITEVETQFRIGSRSIDFFLAAYSVAVEYDEKHHKKSNNKLADHDREKEIRSECPDVVFIRVLEGEEIQGLNRILKTINSLQTKGNDQ